MKWLLKFPLHLRSFICKQNHSENFSTESKFRDTLAYPFHLNGRGVVAQRGNNLLEVTQSVGRNTMAPGVHYTLFPFHYEPPLLKIAVEGINKGRKS